MPGQVHTGAVVAQLAIGALELLGVQGGDQHTGPVREQPARDPQPDPGRPAGDHRRAALQRGSHRMIARSPAGRRVVMSRTTRLDRIRSRPSIATNR